MFSLRKEYIYPFTNLIFLLAIPEEKFPSVSIKNMASMSRREEEIMFKCEQFYDLFSIRQNLLLVYYAMPLLKLYH
jgi:hypothetical protein